jgi:hypothetical protein
MRCTSSPDPLRQWNVTSALFIPPGDQHHMTQFRIPWFTHPQLFTHQQLQAPLGYILLQSCQNAAEGSSYRLLDYASEFDGVDDPGSPHGGELKLRVEHGRTTCYSYLLNHFEICLSSNPIVLSRMNSDDGERNLCFLDEDSSKAKEVSEELIQAGASTVGAMRYSYTLC